MSHFLVSLVFGTAVVALSAGCKVFGYERGYGGHCFKLHRYEQYDNADKRCRNKGAWLVTVEDDKKNEWLRGFFYSWRPEGFKKICEHYWIG